MPYPALEKMYSSLTTEQQQEAFDFISFLFHKKEVQQEKIRSPKDSYSKDFFTLFGSCSDETFTEPADLEAVANEDELF